jgi:hypothetical protein
MKQWIQRKLNNPKTTVLGLVKIIGSVWFVSVNHTHISPESLMQPDTFLPVMVFVAGISSLLSEDERDTMKASEVKPSTDIVGDK